MKRIIIMIAAVFIAATSVRAGGFEQPNQSASAAGLANAFVATANDASALIYNPAGIAWQAGVNLMGSIRLDYRDSSVASALTNAPNQGTEPMLGSVYATWAPLDSHWSGGLGFSPLYHLNNDWSTAFGVTAGITKLTVDHATADVVYALNSDLAFALGGDWYVSRAALTQGTQTFDGSDFAGFGAHVSLMWKPMTSWSIGLMGRLGSTVDMSAQAKNLTFKLPDQITAGIAHDFADVFRLETDVKWTRWSALKNMHVLNGGLISQSNPLNLRDTLSLMTGLTWSWRESAQLRIGYAYEQGANQAAGFSALMADQDGHRFSLGAGGDLFGVHMDLAYQYVLYPDQEATGAFAGTYSDRRQSLMLSVSKTFE